MFHNHTNYLLNQSAACGKVRPAGQIQLSKSKFAARELLFSQKYTFLKQ